MYVGSLGTEDEILVVLADVNPLIAMISSDMEVINKAQAAITVRTTLFLGPVDVLVILGTSSILFFPNDLLGRNQDRE